MSDDIHVDASGDKMKLGILLKRGIIVNSESMEELDLLIEGDKIREMRRGIERNEEKYQVIDCSGKYILPGGIDIHTELLGYSNGLISCDGYKNGTEESLKGGTTLIGNSVCPDDNSSSLIEAYIGAKQKITDNAHCPVLIHICLLKYNENVANEIRVLIHDFGVTTFKIDLSDSRVCLSDVDLYNLFSLVRRLGGILLVQCGNGQLFERIMDDVHDKFNIRGPEGVLYAKNDELIEASMYRIASICNSTHCPTIFVNIHNSKLLQTASSLKNGLIFISLYSPTLKYDADQVRNDLSEMDAEQLLSNPPVSLSERFKTKKDVCQSIVNGCIDVVVSGHKKFGENQKCIGMNKDFRKLPLGVGGVRERMSIFWNIGVSSGKLNPCQFVTLTSTNPARILNIYPQKGCLQVGADADILIWPITGSIGPLEVIVAGQIVLDKTGQFRVPSFSNDLVIKLNPFSNYIYSKVAQQEEMLKHEIVPLNRKKVEFKEVEEKESSEVAPKEMGKIGKRPASKCGGRNLQDTTFSFAADMIDQKPVRPSIRTHQPPGGKSTSLW